jgi:hypothetical protein
MQIYYQAQPVSFYASIQVSAAYPTRHRSTGYSGGKCSGMALPSQLDPFALPLTAPFEVAWPP